MKKRGWAPFTIFFRLVSSSAVSAATAITTTAASATVAIATATSAAIAATTVSTTTAASTAITTTAASATIATTAASATISSAAVSTTAATATIAATTSAAITAVSTAATATGFVRFFHRHFLTADGRVVQRFDGSLRLGLVRHVHKPEAFASSRFPIHHHFRKIHCAIQFEHFFQVHVIKIIGKTCYKKLHADRFKR
jgi:hypothetical protein